MFTIIWALLASRGAGANLPLAVGMTCALITDSSLAKLGGRLSFIIKGADI